MKNFTGRLSACALAIAAMTMSGVPAAAASFTPHVMASGTAVSATQPDSVSFGDGSLWIEYGNGASSTDYSGKSTIVQYSGSGAVQNTWSLAGSVDGLKVNPNNGMVWALQNQDANAQLSIIDPTTKAVSTYHYGAPYTGSSSTRGFDDVVFLGSSIYLSETNPATTSDPVIVKLNSSTLSSPILQTSVVTGAGLTATDPDSLKPSPTGGLVLSSGSDGTLSFISNPGTASQSGKSVTLSGAGGVKIGSPDDSIYATSTSGTFYMTDTKANTVIAVKASGLTPGSLFVNVGTAFGSVDPSTGVVTPLMSGSSLHGLTFVASPEPGTLGIFGLALGMGVCWMVRRKKAGLN